MKQTLRGGPWWVCAQLLTTAWVILFAALTARGQDPAHPLKPADRSSPRATLMTFLESTDAAAAYMGRDFLPSPSRAKNNHLMSLCEPAVQCLDLSEVAPAVRFKTGLSALTRLYETLSRIELPPLNEIPDADQMARLTGANSARWVIPNTQIALVRAESGPNKGEFLFSPETVAKADDFYQRVRGLAYTRAVPLENVHEILAENGGWMIRSSWVKAMPEWLRSQVAGQAGWKWIAFGLILVFFALFLRSAFLLSRRGNSDHPFQQALAQVALPAYILLAAPVVAYLALIQLDLRGSVATNIESAVTMAQYLAGAWISWRFAPVIAEAVIASPHIAPKGIDAHLIRAFTRLLGMIVAAALLASGADRLGLPVYGIIAGLGVGGLAIALAAQPTIENLIGGMSLFADKSIRVGDFCKCGTDEGTVEAIGIRSTRIRGIDRTVTTIPNAVISKLSVVNFGRRDQTPIQAAIGVRYETSPEQLRYLLLKIREMLIGHPRINPDSARARFIGFGNCSLDIEVFAYVETRAGRSFSASGKTFCCGSWKSWMRVAPVSPFLRRPFISVATTDWTPTGPKLPKPRCVSGGMKAVCYSRISRRSRQSRFADPLSMRRRIPRRT
jgi:MscS family membrane protein